VPEHTEAQAAKAYERLIQSKDDTQTCLTVLLLYRWLTMASPGNDMRILAKYWYYQGVAYSSFLITELFTGCTNYAF
jgi:hypothetical protein